ncbi:MAG: hypothetical protein WDW36_007285 [Sanguina aurantia]
MMLGGEVEACRRRLLTLHAVSACQLWSMSKKVVHLLTMTYPQLKQLLLESLREKLLALAPTLQPLFEDRAHAVFAAGSVAPPACTTTTAAGPWGGSRNWLGPSSLPPCHPDAGFRHRGSRPVQAQDSGRGSHPGSDVWRGPTAHALTHDPSGGNRACPVSSPEFGAGGGGGRNASVSRGADPARDGGCNGEDRLEDAVSQNTEHDASGPPVHTTSSSAVAVAVVVGGGGGDGDGVGVDGGSGHKGVGNASGGRSGSGEEVASASLGEACRRRRQAACEAGRAGRAEMRELFLQLRLVPAEGGQLLDVIKRLLEDVPPQHTATASRWVKALCQPLGALYRAALGPWQGEREHHVLQEKQQKQRLQSRQLQEAKQRNAESLKSHSQLDLGREGPPRLPVPLASVHDAPHPGDHASECSAGLLQGAAAQGAHLTDFGSSRADPPPQDSHHSHMSASTLQPDNSRVPPAPSPPPGDTSRMAIPDNTRNAPTLLRSFTSPRLIRATSYPATHLQSNRPPPLILSPPHPIATAQPQVHDSLPSPLTYDPDGPFQSSHLTSNHPTHHHASKLSRQTSDLLPTSTMASCDHRAVPTTSTPATPDGSFKAHQSLYANPPSAAPQGSRLVRTLSAMSTSTALNRSSRNQSNRTAPRGTRGPSGNGMESTSLSRASYFEPISAQMNQRRLEQLRQMEVQRAESSLHGAEVGEAVRRAHGGRPGRASSATSVWSPGSPEKSGDGDREEDVGGMSPGLIGVTLNDTRADKDRVESWDSGVCAKTRLSLEGAMAEKKASLFCMVAFWEGSAHTWMDDYRGGFLRDAPATQQWLIAMYWAVTTMTGAGYGDVVPVTNWEYILTMLTMMVGVLLLGLLIGSVAEMITAATTNAKRMHAYQQKIQDVDCWMDRRALPLKMCRKIRAYYANVWLYARHAPVEAQIFTELPGDLRSRVAGHITGGVLMQLPLFTQIVEVVAAEEARGPGEYDRLKDQILGTVAKNLLPLEVLPGHALCHEGDEADSVWILGEGEMVAARHGIDVEYIHAPCLLGESMMLAGEVDACRRHLLTFHAVSACQLWSMSKKDANMLTLQYPQLKHLLLKSLRDKLVMLQPDIQPLFEDKAAHAASNAAANATTEVTDSAAPTAAAAEAAAAADVAAGRSRPGRTRPHRAVSCPVNMFTSCVTDVPLVSPTAHGGGRYEGGDGGGGRDLMGNALSCPVSGYHVHASAQQDDGGGDGIGSRRVQTSLEEVHTQAGLGQLPSCAPAAAALEMHAETSLQRTAQQLAQMQRALQQQMEEQQEATQHLQRMLRQFQHGSPQAAPSEALPTPFVSFQGLASNVSGLLDNQPVLFEGGLHRGISGAFNCEAIGEEEVEVGQEQPQELGSNERAALTRDASRQRREAIGEAGRAGRAAMAELFVQLRVATPARGKLLAVIKQMLNVGTA